MELMKLRYFVESARFSSFTEAAKKLYTSQPNISKQIASLEKELNTSLFVRGNRSVRLTKSGEYLYEQVQDLPARLEQILETTAALGRIDEGALHIGFLAGQSLNAELVDRFGNFGRCYPNFHFTLERAGFSDLRRGLLSSRYDMIITLSFDLWDDDSLAYEIIQEQLGALFISRMNSMADETDLSQMPFIAISPRESYGGYNQLVQLCHQRGFEPNIAQLADSLDSLLFYVEVGMGVAVLDRNTRLENNRNIKIFPLENERQPDVVVAWLKTNKNPHIQKMVDCLKDTKT